VKLLLSFVVLLGGCGKDKLDCELYGKQSAIGLTGSYGEGRRDAAESACKSGDVPRDVYDCTIKASGESAVARCLTGR
jgi:hypothetical protein